MSFIFWPMEVGATDVDDDEIADLQQKKVPDCAIAADFVDATLTADLCDSRVLEQIGRASCRERVYSNV